MSSRFHHLVLALVLAAAAAPGMALQAHTVLLRNAANAGLYMPVAGGGFGNIGRYGRNTYAATNATLEFLRAGGRRTDSADSYGDEVGMGQAMAQFIELTGINRDQLFVVSKVGPGGLAFPLGFNESLAQARGIVANYSLGAIDLLLMHWPVNYGPAEGYPGPPRSSSIPTTDPACDLAESGSYSEKECRLSTWRGLIAAWKAGLTRAIGVSNFNTTMLEELREAGLPLPAVNQIQWSPGALRKLGTRFTPYASSDTFASVRDWCQKNGVVVNGYSPFGGPRGAPKLFADPVVKAIAAAHGCSVAKVLLGWQVQLGLVVNPEATNPKYMAENLDIFGLTLNATEMGILNQWH